MLTRAKFLRLTGAAAAAVAVTPAANAKTIAKTIAKANAKSMRDDGIVRVKSAYGFAETIERLKKDIAAKGIMFFRSGRPTPTSPGSPRATASSIAPTNSRWRRW